jgi:hypothetical protein
MLVARLDVGTAGKQLLGHLLVTLLDDGNELGVGGLSRYGGRDQEQRGMKRGTQISHVQGRDLQKHNTVAETVQKSRAGAATKNGQAATHKWPGLRKETRSARLDDEEQGSGLLYRP